MSKARQNVDKLNGFLTLGEFVGKQTGDVTALVQAAFDTAASTGLALIGDYKSGGYEIAGIITIKSNTTYYGQGAEFVRTAGGAGMTNAQKIANWQTCTFRSENFATTYVNNLFFSDLHIRDLDGNRDGSFIQFKVNGCTMVRLRLRKQSPNWVQLYCGQNITLLDMDVNCYSATTGAATPVGYQTWCDGCHFNEVSNVLISNPRIESEDDCIAFTIDDPAWDGMQPNPGKRNENITIIGGRLRTKNSHWVWVGTNPGENQSILPVGSSWHNVNVSGMVVTASDDAGISLEGCAFGVGDRRTAATRRNSNFQFSNIVIEGQASDAFAFVFFECFMTPAVSGAVRNLENLAISDISFLTTNQTVAQPVLIEGVANLAIDNVRFDAGNQKATGSAISIEAVNFARVSNCYLKCNAIGAALVVGRYDQLTISDSYISGYTDSPDEFSALIVAPNNNARLWIDNLTAENCERTAVIDTAIGTHTSVIATGITSINVTFPTLPAAMRNEVTGSRGGNAALENLLTQLANLRLIVDSTT